jgi:exosome complex component MTR3
VRSALLPSLRLDLLPKASIDVFITVLQVGTSRGRSEGDDDEACAAAATTVASCALADAGIEMWALVVGVNGLVLREQSQIIIDASHAEAEGKSRGAMSLWTMPALGTITAIEQWGEMSTEEIQAIMEALQRAAISVHYSIAKALKDSYLAREAKGSTQKQA